MSFCPGDPGRSEKIARYFDEPKQIAQNREYTLWTGEARRRAVAVCSTGIGGPSAAIALEELVECGADTFIRVGDFGRHCGRGVRRRYRDRDRSHPAGGHEPRIPAIEFRLRRTFPSFPRCGMRR